MRGWPLLILLFSLPSRAEPLHERVPILGQPGAWAHRSHTVVIDREIGPEPPGERRYVDVFSPSIFPYKRMAAFDSVRSDETLAVSTPRLRPLQSAPPTRGSQVFDGSLVIDWIPNRWIPIPSAGADGRLVRYSVEPAIPIEFAMDGADNWFVRSPSGGRHRLEFTTAVPSFYLAGDPTEGLQSNVLTSDEPRALLSTVRPDLRASGRKLLDRIGVRHVRYLSPLLLTLVDYFRSFKVGAVDDTLPRSGSSYRDLAFGKQGVCRHRAFAFVITALVAGIPARYVENELHVFVEVYIPRRGWRRIDLGGATVDVERMTIEPRRFERPERRHPDQPLRVELESTIGYRGESAELSGSIADLICGELPIELFLHGPTGTISLGRTTAHEGRFRLVTALPRETPLGDHKVLVRATGGDRCTSAASNHSPHLNH
jgi:hypothetical protein